MLHDETKNDTQTTDAFDSQDTSAKADAHTSHLGESLVDLERIGRLWATHGIRMGVAALQTSAVTLTQVASTLSSIAEGIQAHHAADAGDGRPKD